MKIFFFLTLFLQQAWGETTKLEDYIQKTLSSQKKLKGNFEQVKTIAKLDLKLHSSGHFEKVDGSHLTWAQLKPIPSKLRIEPDTIIQTIGDFKPETLTRKSHPHLFSFSKVMISIFNGQSKDISVHFDAKTSGVQKKWTLTLSPRSPVLKKTINKIVIVGSEYIQKIDIFEQSTNQISIALSKITNSL